MAARHNHIGQGDQAIRKSESNFLASDLLKIIFLSIWKGYLREAFKQLAGRKF
jgi:hypothetical protein